MPQTTRTGKKLPEEESLWSECSFAETMSSKDWELKKRTFHMMHNEEMNYNCKQCNVKTLRKADFSGVPKMRTFLNISARNKDWHAGRCDNYFDKMLEENEVSK